MSSARPGLFKERRDVLLCLKSGENAAFQRKNFIPSVKHGGGGIMVWAVLLHFEPEQLAMVELHQQIVKENVTTSVCGLNLQLRLVVRFEADRYFVRRRIFHYFPSTLHAEISAG